MLIRRKEDKRMKKGKVIWALLFIGIAVVILAGGLGVIPEVSGKLIAAVLLGVVAVGSLWELWFWGLFFSLAVIGILYAPQLHIESITPWPILGAAALLSIGFSMLFGKQASQRRTERARKRHGNFADQHFKSAHYQNGQGQQVYDTAFGETNEQVKGEMLFFKNSFGATSKYVNTDNFRSAVLQNSFGEMKVYFDNAMMQQETATIDVSNSFGETQIFLPKEWKVENQISSMLGSVSEQNMHQPSEGHTVILTGSVSMGEVQIIYI